ncbi:ComF family protein [Candidatus Saccharibacteria bacterium]|nr:ComF family protein [Candidatus Saccharibacteria bacterium]
MVKRQEKEVFFTTEGVWGGLVSVFSSLLCRGCGAEGGYLCERCKKYILRGFQPREILYMEEAACAEEKEAARELEKIFQRAEFLGFRDELLGEMVEEYKYQAVRGMGRVIGEMVYEMYFKELLREEARERKGGRGCSEVILVPMATNRRHVRERGFDHMKLVAKGVERKARGRVRVVPLLERAKDTVQVGASDKVREAQAKGAVRVNPKFLEGETGEFSEEVRRVRVVLLDDVWTTGASMKEAGRVLREAGVERLNGLVIVKNRRGASPVIRGGEMGE